MKIQLGLATAVCVALLGLSAIGTASVKPMSDVADSSSTAEQVVATPNART